MLSWQIPIGLVLLVLATHWVADFVLQSDKMATNKSSDNMWLLVHIVTYEGGLFLGTLPLLWYVSIPTWTSWVLTNVLIHWATDYVTSRGTSRLWQSGRRHDFFVLVGFDQLIHHVTLLGSLAYILN